MCTITYLPLSKSSFIVTSNRDESRYRKIAMPPEKYDIGGEGVYYPKDMDANGTWFAAGESRFTVCIMNGAFLPHEHKPPYRLSRGIMVLEFFEYRDVADFLSGYNFDGIEPFTLLVMEQLEETRIHEIRWDGKQAYTAMTDGRVPHIWSSAQLYPASVIRKREEWFDAWLEAGNAFTMENIVWFHKTGGTGDKRTDLVMNRDGIVFTVSITSVQRGEEKSVMRYEDMLETSRSPEERVRWTEWVSGGR